ncbi:MAG: IS982 family transposase [Saprospiraceae bacterium]|nr:IS982 family transposase [Saprospiraceae bacterium]
MDYLLPSSKSRKGPLCCLSDSEIMTILILFQSSQWRNFKNYYTYFLATFHKTAFPKLPSYNRFIEIMHRVIFHLVLFSQIYSGKRTGIYYIDSTCLPVCHLKRSARHKTFDEIAQYGRTSVGWFFGLKLHIVINDRGELIAFKITNGKRNDAKAGESIMQKLQGFMFGDKGYLGKALFARLLEKGLKLITRGRKNMKEKNYSPFEKQLLNKRGIIETVINHFKHHYHIWHTRHRSVVNAMTHLMAGIAAYVIEPLKLSAIRLLASNNYLT